MTRYEETPDGQLRPQPPPDGIFFTGEKNNHVGPGQYESAIGAVRPEPKAAGFGRGPEVDRAALLLSSSIAPGELQCCTSVHTHYVAVFGRAPELDRTALLRNSKIAPGDTRSCTLQYDFQQFGRGPGLLADGWELKGLPRCSALA